MMRILAAVFLCVCTALSGGAHPQENSARPDPDQQPGGGGASFLSHSFPRGVELTSGRNGVIVPRSWRFTSDPPFTPALRRLRNEEDLDRVVAEGADEWSRMVLLCRWAYGQWTPSVPEPYPPFDAREILASARAGKRGGFCAQYAVVLVQALRAMGWQGRYLDIDGEPSTGGHFTLEAWSNQHDKWAVLDPFFGCYFEGRNRPGRPLSSLEVHQALAQGGREAIEIRSVGGDPEVHPPPEADPREYFIHLAADLRSDHLSRPLHAWNRRETYLAWRDGTTDGKPDIYSRFTSDPRDFDFPLNQVQVAFRDIDGDGLTCALRTNMPDAAWIRIERDQAEAALIPLIRAESRTDSREGAAGTPENLTDRPEIYPQLLYGLVFAWKWTPHPGTNRIAFQAMNPEGVLGPKAHFVITYPPDRSGALNKEAP